MGDTIQSLPLFPLGLVLLPHEKVPLHIFEDRYRVMIGECLDRESEFGIIWLSDDGLRDVGCTARIERVLERFDDGRLNILVEGADPFRLVRRIDDLPYPAGEVTLLDDELDGDAETLDSVRSTYGDLVERATEARPEEEDLGRLDAYGMAATLDVALDAKQSLLEQRAESDRLDALKDLFAAAIERIELVEKAAERSRGNGSMHS
jgi:Lon protease-like protein